MLLVLIKMKHVLDLITKTLAVRRLCMSSVFLLVDVACTPTLVAISFDLHVSTVFNLRPYGTRLAPRVSRARGRRRWSGEDCRQPAVRGEAICLCYQHLHVQ